MNNRTDFELFELEVSGDWNAAILPCSHFSLGLTKGHSNNILKVKVLVILLVCATAIEFSFCVRLYVFSIKKFFSMLSLLPAVGFDEIERSRVVSHGVDRALR